MSNKRLTEEQKMFLAEHDENVRLHTELENAIEEIKMLKAELKIAREVLEMRIRINKLARINKDKK